MAIAKYLGDRKLYSEANQVKKIATGLSRAEMVDEKNREIRDMRKRDQIIMDLFDQARREGTPEAYAKAQEEADRLMEAHRRKYPSYPGQFPDPSDSHVVVDPDSLTEFFPDAPAEADALARSQGQKR